VRNYTVDRQYKQLIC